MKLGHWPKFQKLHIHSISTEGGRNWAYFCSLDIGFRDTDPFSKLPSLGRELGHLLKFQKLHIYSLSTPRVSKLNLFSLYGKPFPRYGPIFKIAIHVFGHETRSLAKVPEVAHIYTLSTAGGRNWAYMRSTGISFRDMEQFSKSPYLGMKIGHWPKLHNTGTLFVP